MHPNSRLSPECHATTGKSLGVVARSSPELSLGTEPDFRKTILGYHPELGPSRIDPERRGLI